MTTVLGYGGGVQSVAMVILTAREVLPKPDYIVIADTGREVDSTWSYLAQYVLGFVQDELGMTVHIAPHDLATVDLFDASGGPLMPMWTATGMMQTFCSNKWKQRVSERWLRAQGVRGATTSIGFSLDEKKRVKGYGRKPWLRTYPLLDNSITRDQCEAIIAKQGWSIPHKSACFMCPHRTNEEWRDVRDNHPQQFAEAVEIERDIQANDTRGGLLYLHRSRVSLYAADLDAPDPPKAAVRQCGLGGCYT